MTFSVQITHRLDDGARVQRDLTDVADLGKSVTGAEDIGLTLAEAKALLSELQRAGRRAADRALRRRATPLSPLRPMPSAEGLPPRAVPHRVR